MQQNKSTPANGKKAVPRKEDLQTEDGGKRQRSSAGPVKVAVVLKPIRGKSSNLKTQSKTAAGGSAQPVISQTLSTSTSSLGSEIFEEGSPDTLRKPAREVPNKCGTTESVETAHPSDDAGEESVQDKKEAPRETLKTEGTVEKLKSPSRVSTMKSIFSMVIFYVKQEELRVNRTNSRGLPVL